MTNKFFTELIYYSTIFTTLAVGFYIHEHIPYAVTAYMNQNGFNITENFTQSMIEKNYF